MNCQKCTSREKVKNGFTRGLQRYKCKRCGYNYTTNKRRGKPRDIKRLAIQMYLEGLGFRSIGRILKVSNVSVLNWVREAGEEVKSLISEGKRKKVSVMELDELWHYIGKKNGSAGSGWFLIELPKKLSIGKKVIVAKP